MDPALTAELVALGQIAIIDIVLAGDNAVVVGLAAAGVPEAQRARTIFWGIAAAVVMRIGFAAVTVHLLALLGLTLAGGILLLWVAWKFYREIRARGRAAQDGTDPHGGKPKTALAAIGQIALADLSMSLDNVLAVAGAAEGHREWVLFVGLGFGVLVMGVASALVARLLGRFPWLAYIGLAIVAYVACDMIWRGAHEVIEALWT